MGGKRGKREACLKEFLPPFLFSMGRMRSGVKAFLLLLGFFLPLLESSGRAGGFLMKEVKTFGNRQIAVNLDGQTNAAVSILASDQLGSQLTVGRVTNITTQDGLPPRRLGPNLVANKLTLTPGATKWANVEYDSTHLVPVVIRGWARYGLVGGGLLVVTDNLDSNQASFRFELSVQSNIPTWRILLGLALWFAPGGQLGTAILLGNVTNTGSMTIALDPQLGPRTIYYTYKGCSYLGGYSDSFTLDPRYVPPGQAIVLNFEGWCDWVGWRYADQARVSQAVAVPPDFHQYSNYRSGVVFRPQASHGSRVYVLYGFYTRAAIEGPDDCGGTSVNHYFGFRGIEFVISGAGCSRNTWRAAQGAPGKPGASYTSMPSLTLRIFAHPFAYLSDQNGNDFVPPYRYSLSWQTEALVYQPSPYVSGDISMLPVSSQLSDGTTVNAQVPKFNIHGQNNEDVMAIVQGDPIGVSLPNLVIPNRRPKCVFKNETIYQDFRVYLLDPPGVYSLSPSSPGRVRNELYRLPKRWSLTLPPGLYFVQKEGPPFWDEVYPNTGAGLKVENCTVQSRFPRVRITSNEADIFPAFFAY